MGASSRVVCQKCEKIFRDHEVNDSDWCEECQRKVIGQIQDFLNDLGINTYQELKSLVEDSESEW